MQKQGGPFGMLLRGDDIVFVLVATRHRRGGGEGARRRRIHLSRSR